MGKLGLKARENIWSTITDEQAVQLRHDLTLIEERLQDITILMRLCCGEDSQLVIRCPR